MARRAILLALLALPPAAGAAGAAASPFDDCEARFAADPDGWTTCGCLYREADDSGLRSEAVRRLEDHRTADPDNPCLSFYLGRLYLEDRRAEEAAGLFREAAEGYGARGPADGEVYARINLSDALSLLGAPGAQISEPLDDARAAAVEAGNPVLEAEVAVKEAEVLLRSGGGLDLLEASLRRLRRDAFPVAHANLQRGILLALGDVLYRRGRFAEAEAVFADAVEVTSGAGLRFAEAAARLNRVAAAAAGLPDPALRERVVRLLGEALDAARQAGNPFAEIEARKRLGRLVGGAEGRAHLREALDLAETYRERAPAVLAGVLSASAMDLLTDDPDEARRRVDEASALLLATEDPWARTYGWADRLRVLWATDRESALAAAWSTLEIADRLGEIQETEEARVEVLAVWTEIGQWLAGQLLAEAERDGDPEAVGTAFEVAERMRARSLLESLAAAGVAGRAGALARVSHDGPAATPEMRADAALQQGHREKSGLAVDPAQEAAWRELEGRIVAVHRRLLDPRVPAETREALLAELGRLEREESRLAEGLRRLRIAAAGAAPASPVTLDELRSDLAVDEAVLAFQVGHWKALDGAFAGGAWLLSVTREGVGVHRLPGRVEVEPAMNVFLHLFERRDGSEAEPAATLYDALLREALESLPPGVERLVVVPDGPLHLLPFAALREAPDAPPLAARYELFVTPSATAWRNLRSLEERGDLALAVADPITPGGVPAGEAVVAGGERSWTAGVHLPALPHARREGRGVVRALGDPARLLVGSRATERAVKEGAGRGLRVLHFGTHAVLDEVYPHRSAVVLAPGAADEDGLLRPREAANLDLRGAIVVLSACQSASGTVVQGEGALSLARAFLEGGARVVVGSLWPVDDAETADRLGRFYHHLGRGDTVARALARAQREAVEAGTPAAAWAGWTVLGDGGAVVAPDGHRARPRRWLAWGLALLAALALTALVGARNRS